MSAEETREQGLVEPGVLEAAPARSLLLTYGSILDELTRRGVVRTRDAPAGQYAEWLVQQAYGGKLAPNSERSWDCLVPNGVKVQIKCRVLGREKPHLRRYRQLSPFRTWGFDDAIILLFGADYDVQRAARIPRDVIENAATWSKHVNGFIVHATDQLLDLGEDVTHRLQRAAMEL